MNNIPMENDFIRSHSPHQPNSYTDGIVVDVNDGFVTFVVVAHVYNGCIVKPAQDEIEINCAPLNGRSIFDDPFHPRIEQLAHLPNFSMTAEQARALVRFRAAREVIYPRLRLAPRTYLKNLMQQLENDICEQEKHTAEK